VLEVVIACEHPTLHSGFATVGREVARSLHARGVRVRYVARFEGDVSARPEPYEVFELDRDDRSPDLLRSNLLRSLAQAGAEGAAGRVALLSIGSLGDHAEVLTALGESRSPGPDVVVVYVPVDHAPLPPVVGPTLGTADLVVPYNSFGADAIRRAGVTAAIAPPIPHGVDTGVFTPLEDDERRAVRRTRFDLGDDELLVGFFGRNCGHKRPDLALRIFSAWSRGRAVRCPGCVALVELPVGPIAGNDGTLLHCPHCGGGGPFEPQPARSDVRLYLHTELLTARERRGSGGWDLERLVRRFGVHDRVQFEPSLRLGHGVPDRELARRMAACDVHLLPFESGAWELTVLETAACGVPNVITDTAGPPEYAAPFSLLVPPLLRVHGPHGARAFIDVGGAVAALERLADDPAQRRRLGRRGIEVAAAHRWDLIGDAWFDLLRSALDDTPETARA
jgi:glycosyltransferase involved in cell wall biosynthesis